MTCIVGLVDNGRVYIGGDSAGIAEHAVTIRADEKVFVNNGYLIGFCASFRLGQLLQYAFKPSPCPDEFIERHMVTTFVNELRATLNEHNWLDGSDHKEGWDFLVGTKGRLFKIQCDFNVGWSEIPFEVCGTEDVARGAMAVLNGLDISPYQKIRKTLEIAELFTNVVRPPFYTKSI